MVSLSTLIGLLFGVPLGTLLFTTSPGGLIENRIDIWTVGFVINSTRRQIPVKPLANHVAFHYSIYYIPAVGGLNQMKLNKAVVPTVLFFQCAIGFSHTGQEIYQAVFLHQGPAYEKVQPIVNPKDANSKGRAQAPKAQKELLDGMETKDPGFFSSFEKNMTSGNPELVKGALTRAAELTKVVAPNLASPTLSSDDDSGFSYAMSFTSVFGGSGNITYIGREPRVASDSPAGNPSEPEALRVGAVPKSELQLDGLVLNLTKALNTQN